MFADAMEKAVESADKDLSPSPEGTPSDTTGNEELDTSGQNQEPEAKAPVPQDILDLAKLGKFKVDGEEMSYDDLKRSFLRQQDYTKKTQALAEERKFHDNLSSDLEAVKKNPGLAEQFKQIYPEKFHTYLAFVMNQQANAVQTPEAKPSPAQVPQDVLDRIERAENATNKMVEKHQTNVKKTLESTFSTMEADVAKKYKRADMIHVYGAISDYLEANNLDAETVLENKAPLEKMFDTYAKASHEANLRQYEGWKKEELETVKANNSRGQDIGRGGGTPSGAPKQYKRLGDVADDMIADLNNQ